MSMQSAYNLSVNTILQVKNAEVIVWILEVEGKH